MKKGVIMDIEREYLTMLTPEGEFIKTRNQNGNYQLGDELVFFPLHEKQISRFSVKNRLRPFKLKWISALTAILLFISFLPIYLNEEVYAYMSIDINPSFEIGLDQDLKVVDIVAMNEEAELIVEQIDQWKNQHVDTVTETIIMKSRENGYLNEGQEIIITTVIEDDIEDEEEANIEMDLEADLTDLSNSLEKEDIVITSIKSDEETREKAKKKGVSTGKLIQQQKKQQVEKGNKKVNSGNNPNSNNDKASQKQKENSQKQIKKSDKQLKNEQKEQRKEQRENDKKQQKGHSKDAEIKKEKGKEKAIRGKDNREQRNKNRNNKAKERQKDREGRQNNQQDRQENRER